jgi:hypothetical protein
LKTTGGKMKEIQELNDLNRNVWGLIVQAQQTKNWALMEVNLKRLYALQKKYVNIINLQDYEIKGTKLALQEEARQNRIFERQWFTDLAKKQGKYNELKTEIDKYFFE